MPGLRSPDAAVARESYPGGGAGQSGGGGGLEPCEGAHPEEIPVDPRISPERGEYGVSSALHPEKAEIVVDSTRADS